VKQLHQEIGDLPRGFRLTPGQLFGVHGSAKPERGGNAAHHDRQQDQ
jgi:hypothetical protein